MEFKGTRGKWEIETLSPIVFPNINLKTNTRKLNISCHLDSLENKRKYYGNTYEIVRKGSVSTSQENIANALLISKAPEMLEMLQILRNDYGNYTQNILQDSHRVNRIKEIEKIIKEATEL